MKLNVNIKPHRQETVTISTPFIRLDALLKFKGEAEILQQKTNEAPIALLDDVMSELDEGRQDYILNHMKGMQLFITCCDAGTILRGTRGKTFHIENGKVVN